METIENFIKDFILFFNSSAFESLILYIKIAFFIFGLSAVAFIVFALIRSSWLKFYALYDAAEFFNYRPAGAKKMEKDWKKNIARLDSGLESEYKLAVIEADNAMNDVLKKMGYPGASLAENLDKANLTALSDIENLRAANQIRNSIVHNPDYKLSLEDAKKSLAAYEKALRDLDAF